MNAAMPLLEAGAVAASRRVDTAPLRASTTTEGQRQSTTLGATAMDTPRLGGARSSGSSATNGVIGLEEVVAAETAWYRRRDRPW
jgi:hypothetical protein